MMIRLRYLALALIFFLNGCGSDEESTSLKISATQVQFAPAGGTSTFKIHTQAAWTINNPMADWLSVSPSTGSGAATVTLTVATRTTEPRSGKLVISATGAQAVELEVFQAASNFLYAFDISPEALEFTRSSGTQSITVTTDAPDWTVSTDADWLELDKTSGSNGATTLAISAALNQGQDRSALITFTGDDAETLEFTIEQDGARYPSYNTSPLAPDQTGMTSTAEEIAANITIGWNIGNTLEAIGGETAWGNPKVTEALIDAVKQNGFNAIRIPCAWNQYMENASTAKLQEQWLNRVKEVVQYCIDNDMYVLLNIHWDGGWLENNCTPEKQDENNDKQRAFWEQIATHLRDFDERVMFASANEPNVENATQMSVLASYHQTFVDAVRSTGGKNSYRTLVVQGPSTDIEKTNTLMNSLPTDEVSDRLMVEVHYYTPWNFCGLTEDADWGKMFYYWGNGFHSATDTERNATWGEESAVDANFALMKTKFVDNGIPVVLGEYAVTRRSSLAGDALTLHLASRAYYYEYVTQMAKEYGLIPFYWDNGATGNNSSGLFYRNSNTVFDQQALDALMEGVQ